MTERFITCTFNLPEGAQDAVRKVIEGFEGKTTCRCTNQQAALALRGKKRISEIELIFAGAVVSE